jgi:gamma-glutamyl hercynylcysteine S-oxide synthase
MIRAILSLTLFLAVLLVNAQSTLQGIQFDRSAPVSIKGILTEKGDDTLALPAEVPLFSILVDSIPVIPGAVRTMSKSGEIVFNLTDDIQCRLVPEKKFQPGMHYTLRLTNFGAKNHSIENLVPLGESRDKVYITATGTKDWPRYLCRSALYRPGYGPVGVVLPDNVWHLGFADLPLNDDLSLTGLARRGQRDKDKTDIDRWATTLKPGGWVEFDLYLDIHNGDWHEGLKMMFRDRYLYDVKTFDNAMFERKDLRWMRDTYIMLLQFAWDKKYYDAMEKKYNFYRSLTEYDSLTGGYDIFTLWPTWPRLGLDQRNQWDMYRDLPGGLAELHKQAAFTHSKGKHYFISYNPWDEGTRKEDQLKGMEDLLRATDADGVVLDTRGASSRELQAAADKVKPGIILYSEGMAIPKDMPGIVAGRVHDALVMPPPLNLNKFIKPGFAIFRVLQLADDRLHRELAISFFNGYGVEINTMKPGRPSWLKEEYAYMGRTTRILRENNSVFHDDNWMPLLPTLVDSIYVNRWSTQGKTVYTIFSLRPAGYKGVLFEVPALPKDYHYTDLWNHRDIDTLVRHGKTLIPAEVEPFERAYLGTRREGNAGCIALFPNLLEARIKGDSLTFSSRVGDKIIISGENPSYRSRKLTFSVMGNTIPFRDYFDILTEKIVVQLFGNNELLDERVFFVNNAIPVLISRSIETLRSSSVASDMVVIPEGDFRFYTHRDPKSLEPFIPFADHSDTVILHMNRFYMDKYPVTNHQFLVFMKKTFYTPKDTNNYLRHWINGRIPEGQEDCPVVYVNRDDAKAYASWALKRLPTEAEWQYAAQGRDMRKFPWGNRPPDTSNCNFNLNHPTPVRAHPNGVSPFGVEDMIGNVWQMTNDVYDIGCYYYTIIRGGSYYHPESSIWYVTGGPLPAYHPEMLLLISPGLDRNGTVGFRLVRDSQ